MSCSIFTDANTLTYTVLVILTGHVEMMLRLCCNVRKYSLHCLLLKVFFLNFPFVSTEVIFAQKDQII